MAKKSPLQILEETIGAMDAAFAEHLFATQAKLAKANPKDTGRMASSWFIAEGSASEDVRPDGWAAPGSEKVDLPLYNNRITFRGEWHITNNVPYAERLAFDPLYSKGGAGGPAWFTNIEVDMPKDLEKRMSKHLRAL